MVAKDDLKSTVSEVLVQKGVLGKIKVCIEGYWI
jgi:hypothetical protein